MSDECMNDEAKAARGTYIGPASRQEALDAIRQHSTGPVLIWYPENGLADGETRFAQGWQREVGLQSDEPDTAVFAFSSRDVPLATGIAYPDAFVLDLSADGWTAEQYIGGLDLHFAQGCDVHLVFWHDTHYVTETGDRAPGMGGLHAADARDEERPSE